MNYKHKIDLHIKCRYMKTFTMLKVFRVSLFMTFSGVSIVTCFTMKTNVF